MVASTADKSVGAVSLYPRTKGQMVGDQVHQTAGRTIAPKDVFERCNMPSWWERLTGVDAKSGADREFLVFVAARYRGEEVLPHPRDISKPTALHLRKLAGFSAWAGFICVVVGLVAEPELAIVGASLLGSALVSLPIIAILAGTAIRAYYNTRAEAMAAQSRLTANRFGTEDATTLNEMIRCDEGTLLYCAAKLASEIEQDPAWRADAIEFVQIRLWDELAAIGKSASHIACDRRETEQLERGRLRDDDEIKLLLADDRRVRKEAIAALAARVSALADYRDRVHRCSARELRDRRSLSREISIASDTQARGRLS